MLTIFNLKELCNLKSTEQLIVDHGDQLLIKSEILIESLDLNFDDRLPVFNKEELSFLDLLEMASVNSFIEPHNLHLNLKYIELAEIMMKDKRHPFTITSIKQSIMRNFSETTTNEFDVHSWFKNNYKNLLNEEYKLANRENNPKHKPDVWLSKCNEFVPVEIKLESFTNKSLRQLKRYMSFYKTNEGVAVAKDLRCDLPKNIKFIKHNL